MDIRPIPFRIANEFIRDFHRHHKMVTGGKFCIGLYDDLNLVGVAICGRPVSRYYDDGFTLEINRLCVLEGIKNACSMLYGRCCRIARAMGYRKVITYILASENGASLKASNFVYDGESGGEIWTGKRKRDNGVPKEKKQRYIYLLN